MKEKEKKIKNSEDKTTAQASPEKYIKELRRQRRQNIFFAISTLLAICALGLAWFVSNTRVSGTGIQISAQGSRFELASVGNAGLYDVDKSMFKVGTEKIIEDQTYYCSNSSIVKWMMDSNSNIMNKDEEHILRPGTSGQITFYIIPLTDNVGTITIDLSVTPYTISEEETSNSISINNSLKIIPIEMNGDKNKQINALLNGHLLFFEKKVDNKYSSWIQDGKITVSPKESYFSENSPQAVTIYWIWPLQFDFYVTKKQNFVQLFTGSNDWQKFHDEIKDITKRKKYLVGDDMPEEIELERGMDESPKKIADFRIWYNEGDQIIGDNIRYFLLKVEANEE